MNLGYARISTDKQNADRQRDALEDAGIVPANLFVDVVSGTTSQRPQLDILMGHLRSGDTLIITPWTASAGTPGNCSSGVQTSTSAGWRSES